MPGGPPCWPLLPGGGGQVADRARAPQPLGRGCAALSPPLHWGGEGAGEGGAEVEGVRHQAEGDDGGVGGGV